MPHFFSITDDQQLQALGDCDSDVMAHQRADDSAVSVRFLVPEGMARLLLRRLRMFSALEPLPGLQWFAHFEWDGKLYLLEELGSLAEAGAILASCDDEPVALLDRATMLSWMLLLERALELRPGEA